MIYVCSVILYKFSKYSTVTNTDNLLTENNLTFNLLWINKALCWVPLFLQVLNTKIIRAKRYFKFHYSFFWNDCITCSSKSFIWDNIWIKWQALVQGKIREIIYRPSSRVCLKRTNGCLYIIIEYLIAQFDLPKDIFTYKYTWSDWRHRAVCRLPCGLPRDRGNNLFSVHS